MYICSKTGRRKIAHVESCPSAKQILPRNQVLYKNAQDAMQAGYRVCKHCAPIKTYVKRQEKELDEYGRKYGVSYQINWKEGCLQVATVCSQWKIIVAGRENLIFLYHKNFHGSEIKPDDKVPGYHTQKIRHDNILDYFEYIKEHDSYRLENPKTKKTIERDKERDLKRAQKGTKRYKNQMHERKEHEKKRSIARVLAMIDAIHSSNVLQH